LVTTTRTNTTIISKNKKSSSSEENMQQIIQAQVQQLTQIQKTLLEQSNTIEKIAKTIIYAFQNNNKLLIFGNGGSAADAQHIAAELLGRFYLNRKALPAIALSTNTSILTALANDFGYETIFQKQIEGLGQKNDIALGISTSGNSKNIVLGLQQAKQQGLTTIGFLGRQGKMLEYTDIALTIDHHDTPRIQEAHITAGHIICELVERELFS